MELKINNQLPVAPVTAAATAGKAASTAAAAPANFADIFALKFSAHAQNRLKSRNIEMSSQMMDKLNSAVQGAAKKGSNNSLILLSDLAFIVNVPNRTVVTALDGESIRDNVFTNIDSTVLAR